VIAETVNTAPTTAPVKETAKATQAIAQQEIPAPAAANKKETPATKEKVKAKKRNELAFTLSAGPDVSMVRLNNTGKMEPVFGAGISYTFNKKFTISSGFYTARKVYDVIPSDYKFSYIPPNINYLTAINADCKVAEIPVNLAWNFGIKNNRSFFVSTGLSSFLMKKEKYDYIYTYPGGNGYTYTSRLSNQNKHFFSVLNLSAGYRRELGKNVFVSAGPYFKMPVKGVGEGKVKLNSAGVLFSIGIKPF
jgi:hypothetical protein